MKKLYSIGWLIGIVVLLTLAGIGLLLLPTRDCSLCTVAVVKPRRPSKAPPLSTPGPLDCPQCRDRGKVPLVRLNNAATPTGRTAELISLHKHLGGSEVGHVLNQMIRAGGGDSRTVMGLKHFETPGPRGEVRFAPLGARPGLLVLLGDRSMVDRASLVLVSPEGALLDVLHATCSSPTGSLQARLLHGVEPDGAVACIRRTASRPDFPPEFTWYDREGRIPVLAQPHRTSTHSWDYRIAVDGDGFRILSGSP